LAPSYWKVGKKTAHFTIAPSPGPHKKFECIPLGIIVRDILKIAETYREAKKIIKSGEVLVDGKPRKNHKYPVGLMDVISIPKIKKNYRVTVDSKGLKLISISEKDANLKLCKINNKTKVKGDLTQLNCHDGRNILIKEDVYKTGDSLVVEVPSNKIVKHIKLIKGSLVLITKGKNAGKIVKVEDITTPAFKRPSKVICKENESRFEVLKEHVLVIGIDKPEIEIGV
jgi:small subunit ribosomal protein S4e